MTKMTKEEKVVAFRYAIAASGAVKINKKISLPRVTILEKKEDQDAEETRNTTGRQGRPSSKHEG